MYTDTDYETKAALKRDVARGKQVTVHQPGGMFPAQRDGEAAVEGPHYPKPHKWYARVLLADGRIVRVLR